MVINRLQSDRKIDNVVMISTHMVTNGIKIGYKMVEKRPYGILCWYFVVMATNRIQFGYKLVINWPYTNYVINIGIEIGYKEVN